MRVESPAKNGIAYTRGLDHWGYKSKSGFVGSDSFILAISGDAKHGKGTTNLTVNVNVTP
jgi:hypothetical protein